MKDTFSAPIPGQPILKPHKNYILPESSSSSGTSAAGQLIAFTRPPQAIHIFPRIGIKTCIRELIQKRAA